MRDLFWLIVVLGMLAAFLASQSAGTLLVIFGTTGLAALFFVLMADQ